jgi:hypothetical protein
MTTTLSYQPLHMHLQLLQPSMPTNGKTTKNAQTKITKATLQITTIINMTRNRIPNLASKSTSTLTFKAFSTVSTKERLS